MTGNKEEQQEKQEKKMNREKMQRWEERLMITILIIHKISFETCMLT